MLEPWAEMVGADAAELYATCEWGCPEMELKQQRRLAKVVAVSC